MSTKVLDIDIKKTTNSNLSSFDPDNIIFGSTFTDHMFIADYINDEWQDIRIVPTGKLQVHPANSMWHYGQSIFEGMKAYKNENGEAFLFRPEMNAHRLNRSAIRMCMPELPVEIFLEGLHALMSLDKEWIPDRKGSSLYIRPFMMAWDNFLGVRASKSYRFMIICSPAGMYYAEPVKVKIEQKYTRAANGGTGMAKAAGNYGGSLYPAKLAAKEGYHQLIWTDAQEHRYVEEAGTMNLMFKIEGKLVTSPLSDTILAGVTRNSVLEIGRSWGLETDERKISVDELIRGLQDGTVEEAFGVGTAATVAQIKSIGLDGVDYDLPPISEDSFQVKINTYLEDLRKGHIEDPFNWRIPIT
ncbi:MAG TPA: branched chain amino acid aminotransferase [Flavobacteriales bacterium]|jgi:branched-chain amino acid aminotransferase|nr:branched chain amino acid aminotransferase [Flavobacteriales bacterium]